MIAKWIEINLMQGFEDSATITQLLELIQSQMNPLQQLIIIAKINESFWEKQCEQDEKEMAEFYAYDEENVSEFPQAEGKTLYPNLELAGVAGMYQWLLDNDYTVVFANDLASSVHGIDAVAKHNQTGQWVVCEAKGTAAVIKAPASYLTKNKAQVQQLSWQWIWEALLMFADFPTTAKAFLALYEPMILNQVNRVLSVTQAEKRGADFVISTTKVWEEEELQNISKLQPPKDWQKQRLMLTDINNSKSKKMEKSISHLIEVLSNVMMEIENENELQIESQI